MWARKQQEENMRAFPLYYPVSLRPPLPSGSPNFAGNYYGSSSRREKQNLIGMLQKKKGIRVPQVLLQGNGRVGPKLCAPSAHMGALAFGKVAPLVQPGRMRSAKRPAGAMVGRRAAWAGAARTAAPWIQRRRLNHLLFNGDQTSLCVPH